MGDEDASNVRDKQVIIEQQIQLSEDLIIQEILTRLPVNSVLRFKSVSKHWYSTLSSSQFATNHLLKFPLSHPSAPVDTLFIQDCENYYLFNCHDNQISDDFEDNLVKLDLGFGREYELLLTGCCNGLICLIRRSDESIILWNPATHKLRKCGSNRSDKSYEHKYDVVTHGFGYVSSVDDYKIVQIRLVFERAGFKDGCSAHVFSLKENKWKEIRFDHDFPTTIGPAVLINEKLYWVASNHSSDHSVILSFDLEIERFSLPGLDCLHFIGVMGGALSICSENNGNATMHLLEASKVVKSFDLPREMELYNSQMIGFTRVGKFFVVEDITLQPLDFFTLGIVDTRTNPPKYSILKRFKGCAQIARYFPSLVSPFPHGTRAFYYPAHWLAYILSDCCTYSP